MQLQVQQYGSTHTHIHLMALCPGLPGWASTRKVKPIWILLEQETVSGSGTRWAICKSAPRTRQTTMPAPYRTVFYRPPNQQCQSTESSALTLLPNSSMVAGYWNTNNTLTHICILLYKYADACKRIFSIFNSLLLIKTFNKWQTVLSQLTKTSHTLHS